MKRIISCFLVFVTVLGLRVSVKAYSASAYAVMESGSGRMLYSSNGDARMPMASTTKVMTALIVAERLDLDKEYTVPDEAVGIEGSSIYLARNEVLTGRELLYGLMLASGNDAAYALAVLTSGSVEKFVEDMNRRAGELGLVNTHFSDPCGLKSKDHYTTATELARLCCVAMDNETVRQVAGTREYTIRGQNGNGERQLRNKNRLLTTLEGGDGIKTGYTMASGRCLCASATRNGMQVICVVLNDREWFDDCEALINKAFDEFTPVKIAQKDKKIFSANIFGGKSEKCDIIAEKDAYYPLKKGEYLTADYSGVTLESDAPINKGDSAGEIRYYLNGEAVASVRCVLGESIPKR